ncbi:MAG: GNAT family N-acetyltransferase [Eubacteriales bacterium]
MIEYRKATIEDIENLLKVRIDFLLEAKNICTDDEKALMLKTNRDFLNTSMIDGSFIAWIAIVDNDIVATSSVSIYKLPPHSMRPNGKVAYIGNMFTYPKYRNQGIATRLFSLSVDEAKKNDCKQIVLNATDMGRPIYEKYGFKDSTDDMVYFTV